MIIINDDGEEEIVDELFLMKKLIELYPFNAKSFVDEVFKK